MGTTIFIGSRPVAGAVGSCVADAITCAIFITFAVFIQFAILTDFAIHIELAILMDIIILLDFAICVNGCAIQMMLDVLFWQSLTLHVSLDPEVGEEDKKQGSIHPNEVNDYRELVVTVVHKVPLGGMKRDQNKLDLFGGEISGQSCA